MKRNEAERFGHQLLKMGRQLQADVDTLVEETVHKDDGKATGDSSSVSVDDWAELGSANFCEETTFYLLETATARLREINAALERVDQGTFGSCEECGQDIATNRLRSIPFARHCIQCASKVRQREAASLGNL